MSISPIHWQPSAPLERLNLPWLAQAGVEVAVLRLDLIDPLISGNKWFKLAHHLAKASDVGAKGVISLGGAHSNHLHALAAAGKRFGFAMVGLLRGHAVETPTTEDLQAFGMQLHWLGYSGYRARHEPDFWEPWLTQYPDFYPIPEGGGGLPGALGCAGLLRMVNDELSVLGWDDYHAWWLAAGTGTTLAGLVLAEAGERAVYGAMAVPDDHGVAQNVASICGPSQPRGSKLACESDWSGSKDVLDVMASSRASSLPQEEYLTSAGHGYHLINASRGGFAKTDPALLDFIATSEAQSGIPLESLYTGKALMALHDEVVAGRFSSGRRLIFVHTGGLQGRRGMLL
ncbi:1-aminocyclopropane-1-carboxylate deaminase/D-cysteine desulfhydrase [Pseudomonas syringae]|uniref:1-aminocyclopropane-1-carboxylate deaminase n=1 Tax=Pseudomonas syringae TaxID=317 RepID=A0A085VHP0_PSESX|nr:pyridoxal-phosphate dependent enzyme [Pseudomonas syringae]KFE54953.1 1-aminocyclopropane-1-carboxylate deaminase [Pseudomonas syringae]